VRLFGRRLSGVARPECVLDIPAGHLQKFFKETVKGGGGIGRRTILLAQAKLKCISLPFVGKKTLVFQKSRLRGFVHQSVHQIRTNCNGRRAHKSQTGRGFAVACT